MEPEPAPTSGGAAEKIASKLAVALTKPKSTFLPCGLWTTLLLVAAVLELIIAITLMTTMRDMPTQEEMSEYANMADEMKAAYVQRLRGRPQMPSYPHRMHAGDMFQMPSVNGERAWQQRTHHLPNYHTHAALGGPHDYVDGSHLARAGLSDAQNLRQEPLARHVHGSSHPQHAMRPQHLHQHRQQTNGDTTELSSIGRGGSYLDDVDEYTSPRSADKRLHDPELYSHKLEAARKAWEAQALGGRVGDVYSSDPISAGVASREFEDSEALRERMQLEHIEGRRSPQQAMQLQHPEGRRSQQQAEEGHAAAALGHHPKVGHDGSSRHGYPHGRTRRPNLDTQALKNAMNEGGEDEHSTGRDVSLSSRDAADVEQGAEFGVQGGKTHMASEGKAKEEDEPHMPDHDLDDQVNDGIGYPEDQGKDE